MFSLAHEFEEALDAARGMLRSLALIAMGQQKRQARLLAPLGLAGGDELVDDDLRPIAEVAELGLPGHERLVPFDRVSVLETDGGELGKRRIDHPDPRRPPRQQLQRRPLRPRCHSR